MAWPFSGNSGGSKSADQNLTEERLKILANVAIEQVPFPEQGMLTEEDAWTISPGPTKARLNSQQSVPNVAATLAPAAPSLPAAPATVDTSGLERLISSRLDMVEDVLRMVETRVDEAMERPAAPSAGTDDEEASEHAAMEGDVIITSSGERIPAGGGSGRLKATDEAPLVELYEAQALASNPFLQSPESFDGVGVGGERINASTVAALLLHHMSGMAASSFAQKAMDSGMLSPDEGRQVLAIVGLADPGEAEAALSDHLPNRALLSLSGLIQAWRAQVARSASAASGGMRA